LAKPGALEVDKPKRRRKTAQVIKVEDQAVPSSPTLSAEQTLDLLVKGLETETHNRSQEQQAALEAQTAFTIETIKRVQKANSDLDLAHNQKIEQLDQSMQGAADKIQQILSDAIEGQQKWFEGLNQLSPQALEVMKQFLSSADPNE
jgi:phosphohistidine phosphatase SixA